MRPLFLVMSLSGSLSVFVYCLVLTLWGSMLKARWKQILIRMSVVLYLVPFAYFEFYLKSLLVHRVPAFRLWDVQKTMRLNLDKAFVIINSPMGRTLSKYELWYEVFCAASILLALCVFAVSLLQFVKSRRIFGCYSEAVPQEEQQVLKTLMQQIHLKRNVRFAMSGHITEPLTMGLFAPTIIIPENLLKSLHKEQIILHELAHIKHRDILWRMAGLMVLAVHWYNPVCYFMNALIYEVDEISSDEVATATLSRVEKLQYCNVIIQLSALRKWAPAFCQTRCFTGKGGRQVRRRIDEIMKEKKAMNVSLVKGLGTAMFLCALSIGLIYTPPIVSHADEVDPYMGKYDFAEFVSGTPEIELLESDWEEFFISDDGTVSLIPSENKKALCNHDFVSGILKNHSKQSGGGCVVRYYYADMCNICGDIKNKKLFKTESYPVCPH